jgi:dolichol-phosphate mannosyltransferase
VGPRGRGAPASPRRRAGALTRRVAATGAVWVLLPAYGEAENLPPLLRDLRATFEGWAGAPPWHVVVVDDGSVDRSGDAARTVDGVPLTVIVHPENRGLGAAMRTGIEHVLAHGRDDDVLVSMDADHTHPPELIPAMLARVRDGAPIVIASRYQPGAEIHGLVAWRRWLSHVASGLFRTLFPCARDYTCGYRAYRVGLLRWGARHYGPHFLNQRGFSVMVDVLLKLRRRARRIDEVPLILRYDRKRGASKMKVARTATTTLLLVGRRFVGNPRGP